MSNYAFRPALQRLMPRILAVPEEAIRPSGTCDVNCCFTTGTISAGIGSLAKPGVSVGPGAIALTRIPCGASSSAHDLVRDSTAAFVAP